MKKTLTRLTVMALVATGLVVPTFAATAAAQTVFQEAPDNCLEFFFDDVEQIQCFVDVNQANMDNTPTADEFNLLELRNRVRYQKITLAWARGTVTQTKFQRIGLPPAEYIEASIALAQLRAQVQLIRFDLAETRQQVQIARLGVVAVT